MNLTIDVGNTLIKVGIFQGNKLINTHQFDPEFAIEKLYSIKQTHPEIEHTIFSASGTLDKPLKTYLESALKAYQLSHKTPVNFSNNYQTPQTLGLDRIALVSAAQHLYPTNNVLIIDAGTCITIDLKTDAGMYNGGNISPGIDMRLKALNTFTANLPLVDFKPPKTFPFGKNTTDAILNGVINSVVFEIDEYINRYKSDYLDLTVILTGGNQQYLSSKLKNSIFANSSFQLYGLQAILEKILND